MRVLIHHPANRQLTVFADRVAEVFYVEDEKQGERILPWGKPW